LLATPPLSFRRSGDAPTKRSFHKAEVFNLPAGASRMVAWNGPSAPELGGLKTRAYGHPSVIPSFRGRTE
jgi:hypothetical protein